METLHDEKHSEHGDEPRAEVLAKNREGKARLRHGVPRTLDEMLWGLPVRISERHAPFQVTSVSAALSRPKKIFRTSLLRRITSTKAWM